ncbi:MAG: 4Fe-4S dicluster domain-containing protein [Planctomycetota bacterium]
MDDRVTLVIDGREIRAAAGTFVLGAARSAGIEIPTLCDHPALEPAGACRLCMVEVSHPDWKEWRGLVTSCLYPVVEGLEVATGNERVLAARRQVLTLLAARCPNAPLIQDLAARHGVETAGLAVDPAADNCILCGLCTRVCEAHATAAIATINRGVSRTIGTFADAPPEDCVGCGACVLVCPTGHLADERGASGYRIWECTFETAACVVERTRCLGCGSCEEACPFAVARVVLHADGRRVAVIPPEHCRGCGACVGACPSGAIDQEHFGRAAILSRLNTARRSVFACGRADLTRRSLPAGMGIVGLPCTGRVSGMQLLAAVTRGGEGALVLGRQQETCRLNGAEDPVCSRVERVQAALRAVGLSPARIRFAVPGAGREGAIAAVREFASALDALGPHPVRDAAPEGLFEDEGLDSELAVLGWLSGRETLRPDGSAWLARHGLPGLAPDGDLLFAGILPYLSMLADPLFAPISLPEVLRDAVAVLRALGSERVGVHVGGCGIVAPHHVSTFPAARRVIALCFGEADGLAAVGVRAVAIDRLLLERAGVWPRPARATRVACDGSEEAERLIAELGHEPVDVGLDPLPVGFRISPVRRREAERRLAAAEAGGARTLLVPDPASLARWAMVTRRGTWRSSRIRPVMAHQLFLLDPRDWGRSRPLVAQLVGGER